MTKINKSWERTRNEVHSPRGVEELRRSVRYGLKKKYSGLAESMWKYEGIEDPRFEDMRVMSYDTVPEIWLMKNGECVWFKDSETDQIHCLPAVMRGGVNIYGKMCTWSPIPVGSDAPGHRSDVVERLSSLTLDSSNSVIMRNDLFGGNDESFVDAMISELVDNTLTMNQLQLLAKSPFVFNVSENNLLSAKNFFLAISDDRPAIFTNSLGESPMPVIESMGAPIDPSLFELFDRFECQILEYLGFPCVPITKRAQQSVSEVQSNDMKVYIRRQEKHHQRVMACERINELWGTDLECVSVIDEFSDDIDEIGAMLDVGDIADDDSEDDSEDDQGVDE